MKFTQKERVVNMKSNQKSKSNVGSKVPTNKELLESKLRKMVKSVLKEADGKELSPQDLKYALQVINAVSGVSQYRHAFGSKELINFLDKFSDLRVEMMNYIDDNNSQYSFYGKSPSGFKYVKKRT